MAFAMSQTAIDDATYTLGPHALATPWRCDKCGAVRPCRTFSFETDRGRLIISYMGRSTSDPRRVLTLCDECWPRWLMWRAREGYDLHVHATSDTCDSKCIARRGGRRTQLIAQMSLFEESASLFFLAKSIDGQPTKNGSPLLMGQRSSYFTFRPFHEQGYYESIGDVDELLRQIRENARLHQIGVPLWTLGQHLLVFEVFESAHHAPDGVITFPKPGETSLGLHCVLQTGYRNSGAELAFVNYWGRSWGKRGFGTVSVDYLRRYFHEAFVTRHAQWGPTPWTFHGVAPHSLSNKELRQRMLIVNPRLVERVRKRQGETWRFEAYQTISPSSGDPVECLNIQTGFGLRMGWVFVRHRWQDGKSITEIPELFLWPTFRRMGVGRALEEFALDRAHATSSCEIQLMLNEADSVVGPLRTAARRFALSLGYEWRWHNKIAPRRVGTAIKSAIG